MLILFPAWRAAIRSCSLSRSFTLRSLIPSTGWRTALTVFQLAKPAWGDTRSAGSPKATSPVVASCVPHPPRKWVPQAGVPTDRSSSVGWRSLAFGDLEYHHPIFSRCHPEWSALGTIDRNAIMSPGPSPALTVPRRPRAVGRAPYCCSTTCSPSFTPLTISVTDPFDSPTVTETLR